MRSVSTRCTKGPRAHADRMAPTRAASSRACSGAAKQALKTLGPKPLLVLPQQDSFLLAFFWGEGHRNLSEFGHTQKKTCKLSRNPPRRGILRGMFGLGVCSVKKHLVAVAKVPRCGMKAKL